MRSIKYRWWQLPLTLIILLAPWQQLQASVKQFTDERGTIHINNNGAGKAKSQHDEDNASVKDQSNAVVNPGESTPSNIFPRPAEANSLASNPNFQASAPEP
jgi:hypothetical protein